MTTADESVRIAAGFLHSLALDADGMLWSWGANFEGQLGASSSDVCGPKGDAPCALSPMEVGSFAGADGLAGGYLHSLLLDPSDAVWAWGYNAAGQLGDGTTTDAATPMEINR